MLALSGLAFIPLIGGAAKGAKAVGKLAKGSRSVLSLNRSIMKVAVEAKKSTAAAKTKLAISEKAKINKQADELLAITKHNDKIIKKYPKGACLKKK